MPRALAQPIGCIALLLGCSSATDLDDSSSGFGLPGNGRTYSVDVSGPSGQTITAWCNEGHKVTAGGAMSPTAIRASLPTREDVPPHREGWVCLDHAGNPDDKIVCTARCRT